MFTFDTVIDTVQTGKKQFVKTFVNNEKIAGEDFRLEKNHFLCGKYAVLRKGKRDLAAVELS